MSFIMKFSYKCKTQTHMISIMITIIPSWSTSSFQLSPILLFYFHDFLLTFYDSMNFIKFVSRSLANGLF